MDDFWKACIGVLATIVVYGIYRFIKKRVKVQSAAQQEVDTLRTEFNCLKDDVDSLKKAVPVIVKTLFAVLLAVTQQKINGECDEAFDLLKDYLANK